MDYSALYQRRLLVTGILMALAVPVLYYGGKMSMDGIHTSAVGWLAEDDPARHHYELYTEKFEGGNSVVVSWENCTLDDSRLRKLQQSFDPNTADTSTPDGALVKELVRRVTSGQSLFEKLTGPPLKLSDDRARARLRGTLLGPDGRTTWLNVVLTESGGHRRADTIDLVTRLTQNATGLDRDEFYLAGPPLDALVIDQESQRSVDVFTIPSAILSFALCWWCLRSFRLTVAILTVAGFGQVLALGSLYYFGVQMDAVLIVLPPLVFVLVVSAGIHLTNYYYDQLRAGAGADAPRVALRNGWLPCWMAALTTAIGMGSLYISRIVPISMFGVFAAGCVLATVGLLFLTLPGVMARWPFDAERVRDKAAASTASRQQLSNVSAWICRHAVPIAVVGLSLLVIGFWGLTRVRTSINVRALFAGQSSVVRDFRWMEHHVANLVPLEVVLHFPPESKARLIDRLYIVKKIQDDVAGLDDVGGTMSVANFVPPIPRGGGFQAVAVRAQLGGHLQQHRQELFDSNFLYGDATGEYWRISARVSGLEDIDYQVILGKLRERVEPLVETLGKRAAPGLTANYTGTMPLVYRAQHALLEDMFTSMLLALVLVWVVMCLVLADYSPPVGDNVLRHRAGQVAKAAWLGGLAMVPNVFPIVTVFGVMGLLNIRADIGSTMTACVALGIAVDDTLHFLSWYRRETRRGATPAIAIGQSFQHCGRAMVQTSLVCGLGMLVFGLSDFVPTQRFAWLMFTLLTTALMADLVLLPAILASPLGSLFAVRAESPPSPPAVSGVSGAA